MNMGKGSGQTGWIAVAAACVVFGIVFGFVLGTARRPAGSDGASATVQGTTDPPPALVDEQQVRTYRDILARDPKNVQAAIRLGNLLYDAGRYSEAVPPYQQAFALEPRNVSLSTDLGTALWYIGRADEALAQYDKSLAIDPTHGQTLFNMGIVKRDGKQDLKGAIAAWERLLAATPGYSERSKVEQVLAEARQNLVRAGTAGLDPNLAKPIR